MKKILSDKLPRILKNKKKLEKNLDVKITNRGKEVIIEGESENEFVAEKVIDALNFGFPFSIAIQIKEEDFHFQIINIKDYTKRHDLERVRARIIGTKGKTLNTLNQLTGCFFERKENLVGIIGPVESIENAQNSIISIIQGAKQSNVYKFLERNKIEPIIDLGLKNEE